MATEMRSSADECQCARMVLGVPVRARRLERRGGGMLAFVRHVHDLVDVARSPGPDLLIFEKSRKIESQEILYCPSKTTELSRIFPVMKFRYEPWYDPLAIRRKSEATSNHAGEQNDFRRYTNSSK